MHIEGARRKLYANPVVEDPMLKFYAVNEEEETAEIIDDDTLNEEKVESSEAEISILSSKPSFTIIGPYPQGTLGDKVDTIVSHGTRDLTRYSESNEGSGRSHGDNHVSRDDHRNIFSQASDPLVVE